MKFYLKHTSNCSRNHRVLQCCFLWLKIQHISERSHACNVYISYQIHITGIRTPTAMSLYFVRLHTSQVYRHQHCVPRRAFQQMPCHTLGGLDTYNFLSVNVSSDYSFHQIILHIQASHYYRSLRAEMCLCLIKLP